jgi:hypothetical protein
MMSGALFARKHGLRWMTAAAAMAFAGAVALVPSYQAGKKSAAGAAAQEKEAVHAAGSDQSTTLNDQTELAVTVYNSNIALVRDVRQLQIPTGTFRLKFMDIAATVNPATVHFRSLTEPEKVSVLEQNYEYDLLEPAKLLNKYVGKEVTLTRSYMENGTTKHEDIKATLLANNNGPVWKIGNDIVTGLFGESYRFPEVPANLYDRPTLLMSLENTGSRKQSIEASYLATNLSWNADYVLTVGRDDKAADLDGWVTVINNSGTAFHNAKLQLVAGDLNRVPEGRARAMDAVAAAPMSKAANQFVGTPHFRRGQRNQTDQLARRQRYTGREIVCRKWPELLLPECPESRIAAEGSGHGVLQIQERGKGRIRSAAAGGECARVPEGFQGRDSLYRRGSHRSHSEGRIPHCQDRQRVRRRLRAQADRLQESRRPTVGDGIRNHAAQSQGHSGYRASERAHRRRLGNVVVHLQAGEDRGVRGAIQRAGEGQRHLGAEVSRARKVVALA